MIKVNYLQLGLERIFVIMLKNYKYNVRDILINWLLLS